MRKGHIPLRGAYIDIVNGHGAGVLAFCLNVPEAEANGGNADLVGILNSLMSEKMALEVYKDIK
jgi:hypothetical protein